MGCYGLHVPASGVDDTENFQAAINKVRSDNGGRIFLDNREYHVGSLNCTNLSGLELIGCTNTVIHPDRLTQPGKVFDFTGSSNWTISNMTIFCSGPHEVWPTYAVYAQHQDRIVIDRVSTPGKWTQAAVGIVGVHSVKLRDSQFSNFDESAAALVVSSLPGRLTSDLVSDACEYHVGAQTNNHTIKLNDCDSLLFLGGICDNSSQSHFLCQGTVKHLTVNTMKFYSEIGIPSMRVVLCNAPNSLSFYRFMNCDRTGIEVLDDGDGLSKPAARYWEAP